MVNYLSTVFGGGAVLLALAFSFPESSAMFGFGTLCWMVGASLGGLAMRPGARAHAEADLGEAADEMAELRRAALDHRGQP